MVLQDADGTPIGYNCQLHQKKVVLQINATDDRQDVGMSYELDFDQEFETAAAQFFISQIARLAEEQFPGQFANLQLKGIF